MSNPVRIERRGSAGYITLTRPEQRNPLDSEMAAAILEGLRQHFADTAVRSIVIDAEGEAFCAGADLKQVQDLPNLSPDEAFAWPRDIVSAQEAMIDASKPVIGAVHGPAYAGGMGLAAMCDIILASREATFATPEVKIGLFPMIIVPQLVRAIPRKVLLELILTGEPLKAEDAYRLGFVNALADDREGLNDLVSLYVERFSRLSPQTILKGRRAFSLLADAPLGDGLRAAQLLNVPFFVGQDFAEGVSAFLEKRPPEWPNVQGPDSGVAP